MTNCRLKEQVIREITLNEKTYLLKEDVINLLTEAAECAQSLSSKNDLVNLSKALKYGRDE
jgi:hypothetical protein